jgi:hypothetical protein
MRDVVIDWRVAMRQVHWLRSTLAILLAVAVGVLDHQAFRWIRPLEPLYYDGVGHALLLLITGFVAGLLLRSWWSLLIIPLPTPPGSKRPSWWCRGLLARL